MTRRSLHYNTSVQGAVELLANQAVHVISPNEIESYYRKSTDVEKQDIASSIKRKWSKQMFIIEQKKQFRFVSVQGERVSFPFHWTSRE